MTDGTGGPRFVKKTPDQFRVPRQRRVQNLDSRAPLDERVLGKIHLPEAAFAEQPDDAVIAKKLACLQRHAFSGFRVLLAIA
jgi:hypothetical protein